MSNSKDFLINRINHLIELFPEIQINYEFDEFDDSHFIQILPNEFYQMNNRFIKEEINIIKEFTDKYPFELVTFFSDNSLIKLDEPTYTRKGFLYDLNKDALSWNFASIKIFKTHSMEILQKNIEFLNLEEKQISIDNISINVIGYNQIERSNFQKYTLQEEAWENQLVGREKSRYAMAA